jgi:hypothetical protein
MAAGCIAERTLRRRRVFVGFVVSKVATIVTVRIQRPIGSGPSEGICSENESLDTEEIAVRIVLRSAAFPPTGPQAACAERTPRAKSGIRLLPNRQDYRPQRRPRLRRVLLCRLRRNQISPPECFRCRVMPAVRYSNWASASRSGTATASDWMLSATAERAATPLWRTSRSNGNESSAV